MPKVKEMTFHKSLKLNRSYNSSGIDFGVTIELEEGDLPEDVKEQGWKMVEKQIEEQVMKIIDQLEAVSE